MSDLRYARTGSREFPGAFREVEKESFRLLEALAARIAETCVDKCGASAVSVRLSKSNLAWPTGGRITVEVRREGKARKR